MTLPFDLQVVALFAVAWAVTYVLHSTILLCGAWLLERRFGDRPEVMSPIWKLGVVGGAFSATLQLSAGIAPVGGRWAVAAEERAAEPIRMVSIAPAATDRPVVALAPAPALIADLPIDFRLASSASAPVLEPVIAVAPPPALAPPALAPPAVAAAPSWTAAARAALGIFALWIVGGLVALIGLVRSWLALHRLLRGRLPLRTGGLADALARLHARAGGPRAVRLSVSPSIRVPLATGVVRPEIVVPTRAQRELSATAQESMLAHELGHVVRRDPSWRLFVAVVQRVLFFQPLLRVASRHIARHAEYLADAWAARHTAEPLALARCLTEIATWLRAAPEPARLSLTSSMAEPASILGRRVLRLVEPAPVPKRRGGAALVLGAAGVFALAWIAPVASWARDESHAVIADVSVGENESESESENDDDAFAVVVIDGGPADAELDVLQRREASRAAAARHDDDSTEGRRRAKKAKRTEARDRATARRDARRDIDAEFRRAKRKGELPDADRIAAIVARAHAAAGQKQQADRIVVVHGDHERHVVVNHDGERLVVTPKVHGRRVRLHKRLGDGGGFSLRMRDDDGNVVEIRVSGEQLERLEQRARLELERLDPEIARALRDAEVARGRAEAVRGRIDAQRHEIERARERAREEFRRHRARPPGRAPRPPQPPEPPFTFDIVPIAPRPAPAPMPPTPPEAFLAPMPMLPEAPFPPTPIPVVEPGFAPPAPPFPPSPPRSKRHRGARAPESPPSA